MAENWFRRLKANILFYSRTVGRSRGVWLRGALCWSIGMILLIAGGSSTYDLRFQLRGPQPTSSDIVLVLISQSEWLRLHGQRRSWTRPLQEISHITDSFYWHPETWSLLLQSILRDQPRAIGISFYFGENIRRPLSNTLHAPEFNDPRVFWSANLDSEGRPLIPVFADNYVQNAGLNDVLVDNDGTVRRFSSPLVQVPHMALRLANSYQPQQDSPVSGESRFINFQGPAGTFQRFSLTDIIENRIPADFFAGKLVIIGSKDSEGHFYRTPLGEMTRAEILANAVDNFLGQKWITPLDLGTSAVLLLLLLILAIWIVSTYPQSVALVFYFWIGIFIVALSLWTFDSFYFWTPILAPVVLLMVTYIVFLSFQLSLKDNLNWRLEQERKYLLEVEQLKNNFVSLISHDLKTPIAKIQAICDRILAQNPQIDIADDLSYLRRESCELHRYIQSILQITRVESRDFKLNKDAADMNELIKKVVEQIKPLARAKKISITEELEPMFLIEVDSVLVQEVILNLVENAVKYSQEGGQIRIISRELDDRVFIEVEDNGPGISPKDQNRVFEKFVRGDTQDTAIKGSGLGLYLVKYFIELHGGEVFLKSQVGKGTRVGFSLPVNEELDSQVRQGEVTWKTDSRSS